MDMMMPEMDGLDATREIRKIAEFQSLPIVSLTAKAMKGDREKCLAAGASDYITKPVEERNLLAMIYSWLTKTGKATAKVTETITVG
jgi:CheY-like chemotaxis protein